MALTCKSISNQEILSNDALEYLKQLHEKFNDKRLELLNNRILRQNQLDEGIFPDFLTQTKEIREGKWVCAPEPSDLLDRRVEITGPVDRKMIINALNSGAKVFMADFEDSNAPTWNNVIEGQQNLKDAINRKIDFTDTKTSKEYKLNDTTAVLFVRPRGWHLEEKNILWNDKNASGSLIDFGLYFFHNAKTLLEKGTAPYFYLPKLENHLEARLWNEIFIFSQEYLGIPTGTIKATVLIETILAAFEMDEILYELKEHSAGLNCGRWDYIFSLIKKFRNHSKFIMPDRAQVTMNVEFLKSYSELLIHTCHKRGVHAMGGMAAQIPIKNDPKAHEAAIEKVRLDKLREVNLGHDGTWVAHPGLVDIALDVFNQHMPQANQLKKIDNYTQINAQNLLAIPTGTITESGLRNNISVGIQYIEAWLRGNGAVAIYNLMEDAATAEISRTQLWQWIQYGAKLEDNRTIDANLYQIIKNEEVQKLKEQWKDVAENKLIEAVTLFDELVLNSSYTEFLTLKAYSQL